MQVVSYDEDRDIDALLKKHDKGAQWFFSALRRFDDVLVTQRSASYAACVG
jgi:hypothetical protein